MFKIIKKGNGNFWHNFNNGSKEVNLSNWEIVLDSINQTVSLQMLNGANVPINSVNIADVVVIDETDISLEETFGSVNALRTRLIELNYTPYIILNGFVPEAPIDGLTYGRKDAEWVEISDSGTPTLQEVLDFNNDLFEGNNFQGTNAGAGQTGENVNAFGSNSAISNNKDNVNAFGFQSAYENSGDNVNAFGFNAGASNTFKNINAFGFEARADADNQTIFSKWISGVTKYLGRLSFNNITADRKWELPDASGTIALTSEIPPSITIDATPTDGSSNAVSSNGVFDALANKVDANAPITGTVKTKITYDSKGLVTNGADALTSDIADSLNRRYVTDAQLVVIGNTSGTNSGDETTASIKSKLGITILSGSNTGDQDLSGLEPKTASTTGSVISFATPQIYNTTASPSSSNFTDDLTGARIGVIQKIYSNKGTTPTFPAGWVLIGANTYTTSVLNIIYAEWVSGSRVEYWIVKG